MYTVRSAHRDAAVRTGRRCTPACAMPRMSLMPRRRPDRSGRRVAWPVCALTLNDFEAEINRGCGRRLPLDALEQYVSGDPADAVAGDAHSRQCGNDLGGQLDIIEAGNGQVIRHPDAAALTFEQGADGEDVVGKEHGFNAGFAGQQIMQAVSA